MFTNSDISTVKVFNPAKTVADCFKFRNKIGIDVALEALRETVRSRKGTRDEIMKYAEIDRVSKVVRPGSSELPMGPDVRALPFALL